MFRWQNATVTLFKRKQMRNYFTPRESYSFYATTKVRRKLRSQFGNLRSRLVLELQVSGVSEWV